MSTEATSPAEPEVLTLGSTVPDGRLRRVLAVVLVILAVGAVGLVAYRVLPRPAPPMTLEELQGVYSGMVRSDGTNDASVLQRRNLPYAEVVVDPAACAPLFDTTVFNQLPAEALDGMSTYWFGGPTAISLFTLRFADTRTATTVYDRVSDAATACADQQVRVGGRTSTTGRLSRTEVSTASGVRDQLGYLLATGTSTDPSHYAVHVLALDNTVTWQFRYEPGSGTYAPQPAQQLMDGLVSQIRAVQELRR